MIILYNKYASESSSQGDVFKIKGAPGLIKYKSLQDFGNAGHNNLVPKPPRAFLKILHNTRKGITFKLPIESHSGGKGIEYYTNVGSLPIETCLRRNF